jgi:sn1-specific diacylglycerol lipase
VFDGNDNFDPDEHIANMHRKNTKLWLRRFRLAFCCVSKDEFGDEAFISHLFRGTDLVPSGEVESITLFKTT